MRIPTNFLSRFHYDGNYEFKNIFDVLVTGETNFPFVTSGL
jgi:hypothetical protein